MIKFLSLFILIINYSLAQLPIRSVGGGGAAGGTSAVAITTSFSATPTFIIPTSTLAVFTITLTNNVSSSTIDSTLATIGQDVTFNICQDTTGSRTFVWPSNVTGSNTIAPNASTCSRQNFTWDGTNLFADKGGMTCPACPIGLTISNLKLTDIASGSIQGLQASATGQISGTGAAPGGMADPGTNGIVVRKSLNTTDYASLGSLSGHLIITNADGTAAHNIGIYHDFLFSMTAPVTVTSTSEATLIGAGNTSPTQPAAHTLSASLFADTGYTLLVEAYGRLSTQAVPGTHRIRLKFGSTVILDTGAYNLVGGITDAIWHMRTLITSRTIGASGTIIAQSIFETTGSALIPNEAKMLNTAVITIDTTVTQAVDFTSLFNTTSNSITSDIFIIRLI